MSMQLAPDFTFRPLPEIEHLVHLPFPQIAHPLGPLVSLPGTWVGQGFNQIWRPFHAPGQDRFLELNLTNETLQIEEISGPIPNRGLLQQDINMFGVHYLQQIKDHNVGAGLHFEPGIWLTVPATTNPQEPPTVARLGSIPHGTAILAQGVAASVAGPPTFAPVDITPFQIGHPANKIPFPESNLSQPTPFRTPPAQMTGITQAMVNNPNSVLHAAIAGQTITHTTVLEITSDPHSHIAGGGTANTAFLQGTPTSPPNADAALVTAIFWIETVKGAQGHPDYLQLQYTQTVLLNFNGLSWPHVSVATLRRTVPQTPSIERVDPTIPADLLKSIQEHQP